MLGGQESKKEVTEVVSLVKNGETSTKCIKSPYKHYGKELKHLNIYGNNRIQSGRKRNELY